MGAKKGSVPWNINEWSADELEQLRTYYKAFGATVLAERLDRPFWEVARKAEKMGLRSGPRVSVEDIVKVEALSELDAAYLAGMIDGEGTVSIKGYRKSDGAVSPVSYINISQTDKSLSNWLLDKLGGYVSMYRHPSGNHRVVYNWHTERVAHVLSILLRVAPYVVIKKPHVALAIEACKIRLSRPRASKTTNREIKLRDSIRLLQMKRGGR